MAAGPSGLIFQDRPPAEEITGALPGDAPDAAPLLCVEQLSFHGRGRGEHRRVALWITHEQLMWAVACPGLPGQQLQAQVHQQLMQAADVVWNPEVP